MESSSIPYTRVPKSSALLLDYLYDYGRVAAFYNGSPFEIASYQTVAAGLDGFKTPRQELAGILKRQNEAFGCDAPTFENIRRLSGPGTFAVVTGQQVGLLSGPAFTLYKALTAVRLAQWLTEQGLAAVPVFWLATEDHDLEEVATTAVLDEDYKLVSLSDAGERPSLRASVGRVRLSSEIEATITRLETASPPTDARERLLGDLRASYQPGATWGKSFGRFMARLFNRWGVVLFDPLDDAVHRLAAPVFEKAVGEAASLRSRLLSRSEALRHSGYHAQVHVGEDSTLLFLCEDGNRLALHEQGGDFLLSGTKKMSSRELELRIENTPLDFTPNALLRPVVQDTLVPTVAYVAGPSELAYHAQTQTLYAEFGRPQPVLFPRAAFTLFDRRTERNMEKYHLSLEDVWKGDEHLGGRIAAASFAGGELESWSEHFAQGERELAALLARLHRDFLTIDPTLTDSLKHAGEKIKHQLDRLKGKLSRAVLERSELLRRHEQSLRRFLAPRQELQEREVSGVYFLGRAGYELLDRLLERIATRTSDHQTLVY